MPNSKSHTARRTPRTQERHLGAIRQLERRGAQDPPPDHPRWLANCIKNLTKRAERKEKMRNHREQQKRRSAQRVAKESLFFADVDGD
jgi:hypothetical protein